MIASAVRSIQKCMASAGREGAVVAMVLLLLTASVMVLARERSGAPRRSETARAFQQMVRGVGLGREADLSTCGLEFDPRVAHRCSGESGPLPMGALYCAGHSFSPLPVRPAKEGASGVRSL